MDGPFFRVQVFPSNTWKQFNLEISTRNRHRVIIQREELLEYIEEILGPMGINVREIAYIVRVLNGGIRNEEDSSEEDLLENINGVEEYARFVNTEQGKKIEALLEPSGTKSSIQSNMNNINDSMVIIMAMPRDVALHYYEVPELNNSVYSFSVYDNSVDEYKLLDKYYVKLKRDNDKLMEQSSMHVPVLITDFKHPDRIAFIAKREERIVGYCLCSIMPYREEISVILEELLDKQYDHVKDIQDMYFAGSESASDLEARYFMGVRPHHLYEIEGLSADFDEQGQSLGLLLIYQALRFILDQRIRDLYPVTHIASQAASYITKRYLTLTYGFRYHGSNCFNNQNFLETIDDKNRELLLQGIQQQVTYYQKLLEGENIRKLRELLPTKREVIDMMGSVIQLYQLYYLLVKTSGERAPKTGGGGLCGFNCQQEKVPASFLSVFERIQKILALPLPGGVKLKKNDEEERQAFESYFGVNVSALRNRRPRSYMSDDRHLITALIKSDTKYVGKYTFLRIPSVNAIKEIHSEGYEVIYDTLPNMVALSEALGQFDESGNVLGIINEQVVSDLSLPFDYELPNEQLAVIQEAIEDSRTGLHQYEKELDSVIALIVEKRKLVNKNVDVNLAITKQFYNIRGSTSGLDSFLSFERLDANWPKIEASIMKRISSLLLPPPLKQNIEIEIDVEEQVDVLGTNDLPVIASSPPLDLLPLPNDMKSLVKIQNRLYRILFLNPSLQTRHQYGGYWYTTRELGSYIKSIKDAIRSFDIVVKQPSEAVLAENEDEGMNIEIRPYTLEDFIEDDLLNEIDYSILGDETL